MGGWGGLDAAGLGDRAGTRHGATAALSLHLALLPLWGFLWGIRSHPRGFWGAKQHPQQQWVPFVCATSHISKEYPAGMRPVASLAISATSCALWQPPKAGTRLPCPTEASGATGIWQHGACAQTPAQALASGRALGCHPGHLKKLQGGLKTSPGGCDPARGVRAPAPRHAAGPLSLLCEADAEMMAAPPGPPGTQQPPHGCSQPWGGHSLAVTQGPKPAMPIPPCLPGVVSPRPRHRAPGVSDPVCTAVPAPGPLRGRLENGVTRMRVSASLLSPGRFLPQSTQASTALGGRGGLAATLAPPGTDLSSSLAKGLGQCWVPPSCRRLR